MARSVVGRKNSISLWFKQASGLALLLSVGACANVGLKPGSVQPRPVNEPVRSLQADGWLLSNDEHGRMSSATQWTLTGAPVLTAGHTTTEHPLFRSVTASGEKGAAIRLHTSAQLQCYAREQGAFWTAHQQGPSEVLERYMAAACGLWGYRPVVARKQVRVEGPHTVRSEFRRAMKELPAEGMYGINARSAGAKGVVLTLVYDFTPIRFELTPTVAPGDGVLKFSGTSAVATLVNGTATKGKHSWSECRVAEKRGDRNSAVCRYSTQDDLSLIDLAGHLADETPAPVFRVGAFGSKGVSRSYPAAPRAKSRVEHTLADSGNFMQAVNEARRRAGTYWVVSDSLLGLRIDEWWRKEEQEAIRREFFRKAGDYTRSITTYRPMAFASFISPKGMSAGEAVNQALALPQVRAVVLNSRIQRLAVRQYKVEGRDSIETVVAAILRR